MKDYILLILSAVLTAASLGTNKIYQRQAGISAEAGLNFIFLFGAFSALMFWVGNGFHLRITLYSAVMASLIALLSGGYTMIGFRLMKEEKMTLYTLFLMTGGMMVPYVWGLCLLDEPLNLLHTVGLVIITVSIVLSNHSGLKSGKKQTLLCIAAFFLNGFVSVVSKEHQINGAAVSSMDFMVLCNLARVVFGFLGLLFVRDKGTFAHAFSPGLVLIGFLSAVVGSAAYFFQLIGAKNLPATVLYPIVTGGTILFTALLGRMFFKERLTPKLGMGLALCFVGTCMFL